MPAVLDWNHGIPDWPLGGLLLLRSLGATGPTGRPIKGPVKGYSSMTRQLSVQSVSWAPLKVAVAEGICSCLPKWANCLVL